jgi:hypothetical protein
MKEDINNELKDLSPWLSDLKSKGDPQRVPEAYFDQLESSVFQRLEQEGLRVELAPERSVWSIWLTPARLTAAAAAITLLIGAIWWMQPKNQDDIMVQTPPTTEEEFTPEMAEDYIQSNIFDFDEELLADEMADDATEGYIAPDQKPKEKRRNKLPKDMNELDDIMSDLTDEELEDLL